MPTSITAVTITGIFNDDTAIFATHENSVIAISTRDLVEIEDQRD